MSTEQLAGVTPVTFMAGNDQLHGRFTPSQRDTTHATILLLDDFPGGEQASLKLSYWLPLAGFHVLTFPWRGTPGSDGTYSLAHSLADIDAALAYLHSRDMPDGIDVDPANIVLGGWGHGGGLALSYAASHPLVRHIFTVAATDLDRFAYDVRTDAAQHSAVSSRFAALAHPGGPVRFAGEAPLSDLLANAPAHNLRQKAAQLADRHLLLIGGWQDEETPVEKHLLPFYRALQQAGTTTTTIDVLTADHFFTGRQFMLAKKVREWIQGQLQVASTPEGKTAVSLREVTEETLGPIIRLKVTDEQGGFVAPNEISIAQAYFQREHAWFRGIYAGDTAVGFLMLYDDPEKPTYFLWRFMIDARYQGLGYGRQAMQLLIDHVKTRPNAAELLVSCVPGDGSPCPFYERIGFVYTGEKEGIELVMRLTL